MFQKQKTEKKKIDNNGQLRIANATSGGARKAAWAKRKRERLKVGNNNGQLRTANATSGGERKAAWANVKGWSDQKTKITFSCQLFQ